MPLSPENEALLGASGYDHPCQEGVMLTMNELNRILDAAREEGMAEFYRLSRPGERAKPRPLSAIRVDECEMSVRTTALAKRAWGDDVTLATLDDQGVAGLRSKGFTRKSINEVREVIESMRPR